jgi:mercuric ion transport protein
MPKIELLYDRDCPNVDDARRQLRLALEHCGFKAEWSEWERSAPRSPAYARQYGSPTVLIDGQDVAGEPPSVNAPSCRIYAHTVGRNRGVPDVTLISAALSRSSRSSATRGITLKRSGLAAPLPTIGAALLPKLACPACWPAYAGLLSAMGLGFVDYTPWLLPATLLFLIVTLVALARRPRRGYAPLVLGVLAGALVVAGKFGFDSDSVTYTGVLLLVAASAWNAWPIRACAIPVGRTNNTA